MPKNCLVALAALALSACAVTAEPPASAPSTLIEQVAERPPMGWNSFDAWDSRIDEKTYRETVEFMANNLRDHGWEYAVIDYIWWNPNPGGHNVRENFKQRIGHPDVRLAADGSLLDKREVTMDEFGRLLPSVERFPSSAGGKGFKPLADWVHSKGMKFGIHIMRGIHREAYYRNTPILGSKASAKDIAKVGDHAPWLNNMFGVDWRQEGAQEYYDSIFRLYAQWGVDYIKADDMMGSCGGPSYGYSEGEISMMRRAIDRSGRPMVLSLSCGEAQTGRADHLHTNANMWRISNDFWDEWRHLARSFPLLDKWSAWGGDHRWPDADMIPFGHISLDDRPHGPDRMSKFTIPEHYTLMTLFSIARSPLMIGSELLTTPRETIETFFTNDEVLYVNQHGRDPHQVIRVDSERGGDDPTKYYAVWISHDERSSDRFVALFNLGPEEKEVTFRFEDEDLRGAWKVRDLWARRDAGEARDALTRTLPAHGAALLRLTPIATSDQRWQPRDQPPETQSQ